MSAAIENFETPVGVITEVHGPVAVIACDTLPPLRQEEIIEEIEVILLNSGGSDRAKFETAPANEARP